MTKPNLNDVKTRMQYMLDGGKVRRAYNRKAYYWFNGVTFLEFNGSRIAIGVSDWLIQNKHDDWEPYEEPKTEETLRKEFCFAFADKAPCDGWSKIADFLYDTFELRKK